ncbi:MAG: T9SS type A sorting domain-containing protein [Stygiobacter sp.]
MKHIFITIILTVTILASKVFAQSHNFGSVEADSNKKILVAIHLGIDSLVCGQFYVVYSGQTLVSNPKILKNTSNIFIIKGLADTVWIFNFGYGDPGGDDTLWSPDYTSYRNAMADAKEVDLVIKEFLHISKSNAKLQFIVPHYHFDHVGDELPTCLFDSLGYSRNGARIIIHANDYYRTTCNEPCCGDSPCSGISSSYNAGNPYSPPWSLSNQALFTSIGSHKDIPCKTEVMSFESTFGTWHVYLQDTTHTAGTLQMDNSFYGIRLSGAGAPNARCSDLPANWYDISVHRNIEEYGFDTLFCSPTSVVEEEKELPTYFELYQNYPNPFNPTTTIRFSLPKTEHVTLKVIDVLGREVAALVNEIKLPGFYEVIWVADTVPSGVYFYQLTTSSASQIRKAILIK